MKPLIYVLDSYALMAFFQKEKGDAQVKHLMAAADVKECRLMMSVVNWGELYYSTVRSKGRSAAQEALAFVEQLPIELVGVDQEMARAAAVYKSIYPIAYADCFAAALAKKENAPVVTGDPEFRLLNQEIKLHWIK